MQEGKPGVRAATLAPVPNNAVSSRPLLCTLVQTLALPVILLQEAGIQPLIFARSSVFYEQGCPTPSFIPIPSCHPPLRILLDSLPFSRIFLQVFPHPRDIMGLLQLRGNCWWGWTFTLVLLGKTQLVEDAGLWVVEVHGPR